MTQVFENSIIFIHFAIFIEASVQIFYILKKTNNIN